MDRKTAIDWLESIRRGVHGGDEEYDRRRKEALDMAIEALKAQESRVMALEEMQEITEHDFIWIEGRKDEMIYCLEVVQVCKSNERTDEIALNAPTSIIFIDMDQYKDRWRCWTARPTEEQREAAKWDAENKRADHIRPYTELSAQTALLEHRYSGLLSED